MIRDDAAANASLAGDYGATHGPNAPASHQVALFAGDPNDDGVEIDTAGGYTRQALTNDATGWPNAAANRQITSAEVTWTSTGEWTAGGVPATATHFALLGADGLWWDTGLLDESVDVPGAGITLTVACTVSYGGES